MTIENTLTLPMKCCAKCGFLYGLAANPANLDDAVFDTDLIRDSSYPPGWDNKPGIITSLPHALQEYRITVDANEHREKIEPEPIEIRELGWADTVAICCYKNQFPKVYVERKPFNGPSVYYREFVSLTSPKNRGNILTDIRNDRQDCPGFFEYHPGYSPPQHIQLELDEPRHNLRTTIGIAGVIIGIASVVIAIAIGIASVVIGIVQPLVEYLLPIIFGSKPIP